MQNAQKHQPFNLHHAIQVCPSMENKPEKGFSTNQSDTCKASLYTKASTELNLYAYIKEWTSTIPQIKLFNRYPFFSTSRVHGRRLVEGFQRGLAWRFSSVSLRKPQSSPCFGFSVEAENQFKSLFCSFKPLTRFSVSRLLTR
jgi:hypothetical protein